MTNPTIYALDFDGVICDSAVETAITGWKAAASIWQDMPENTPQVMIDQFRLVRPMIETGYEAILAMRLLFLRESVDDIYAHYAKKTQALMNEAKLTIDDLKALFGDTRDRWIADDLGDWVTMNPLFDGIADKLKKLSIENQWFVITTKQERFVKLILQAHSIELLDDNIFGLDRNLSKVAVLTQLVNQYPDQGIYFVEDRLPTLVKVAETVELAQVKLVFALWGYNTEADKSTAARENFASQQLNEFLAYFY